MILWARDHSGSAIAYKNLKRQGDAGKRDVVELLEIFRFGLETNEGFTEYKLDDTSETTISYVKYIPDWNLIISSSKSNVTYDYLVDDFTTQNYNYTIIIKI